jgi:transposase
MKSREELLRQSANDPVATAEYAFQLQQQLIAREQTLRQQQQSLVEQKQLLTEQEHLLAEARAQITELKRQIFGPKADRLNAEQEAALQQLTGDMQEAAQRPPALSQDLLEEQLAQKERIKQQVRARQRRHPLPAVQLEVQRVVLEPADKDCGVCRGVGRKIGEEVSTEYEYVTAKLICKETVRPKYALDCACALQPIRIAPLPPRLVPQSKLGTGLAVYLLLSRFDDHIAYYTLERIFRERHNVIIPRQQIVQWVEKIAFLLLAIYHLIWEELAAGDYLQVDETPVKVLDPEVKGKAATGYLWFYSAPKGDVFLEFCDSRGRESPKQRLRQFNGTIQTDAYGVYQSLQNERPRTLRRLACLAHSRRYFYKALQESCAEGVWFIQQIRAIYQVEDELRQCTPEERKRVRRQKTPALWRAMKRRADQLQADPRCLPQSSLGKAVNYFLKEYTALVGYLRDGRYEVDNNLVENSIRPSCIGKKRWLFIGHPDAGWRSAVIYTIIQSCRRRGINPQEYLTDVLRRLPAMTNHQVKDLVPSRWQPESSNAG